MKNRLFVLLISALLLSSCGKYDEGPGFSLSSKKSRIVNEWVVSKVFENDVEFTDNWNTMYPGHVFKYTAENTVIETINNTVIAKTWEFDKKKDAVIVKREYGGKTHTQINDIVRLTKKEYWYTTTIDNKTYRFELKEK